jgi:ABC-2 type transport system permease protein
MSTLKMLGRVIGAERLKMRRTLALALTIIIPLALIVLEFAMTAQTGINSIPSDVDSWLWISQSVMVFWSLLMLPLFVTLQTALLGNMEYRHETWKKLFSLPVPRWMVILAKQLMALALIALSCLVMIGLTVLMGFTLNAMDPGYGLGGPPPWLTLLKYSGLVFLASWLIVAINLWVALNWSSFVASTSFGIVATISGVMIINSERFGPYYPWAIPGLVGNQLNEGTVFWPQVLMGLLGGVLVFAISNWQLSRKQIY